MLCVLSCCHVRLFVTPWTVAHQAPLSLGMAPGQNAGMGCHALLQGIFPTQGSKPGLPHCRWILYHLSHQGSPKGRYEKCESESQSCPTLCNPVDYIVHGILQAGILEWVVYPFSSRSSLPRN